jgi:hypothetical protein
VKDEWKPVKLVLVGEQQQKRKKGAGKKREKAAQEALKQVSDAVAEELRKELDDVEMDLEAIVAKAYVIEEEREGWQYRVRFVGYGARDDEWYWEKTRDPRGGEGVQQEVERSSGRRAGTEIQEGQESAAEEEGRAETKASGGDDNGCKCRRESSAGNGAAAARDARNRFAESAAGACGSSQFFAEMTAVPTKRIPGKRLNEVVRKLRIQYPLSELKGGLVTL